MQNSVLESAHGRIGHARQTIASARSVIAQSRVNRLFVCQMPMSMARVEWEYIHFVLRKNGGNVTAAARALSMHRRTLQRKLEKHAPH